LSQMELKYHNGCLTVVAPDDQDGGLAIDPKDLLPDPQREIAIKLYDSDVRVLLVGKKFDDYVTRAVSGKIIILNRN